METKEYRLDSAIFSHRSQKSLNHYPNLALHITPLEIEAQAHTVEGNNYQNIPKQQINRKLQI